MANPFPTPILKGSWVKVATNVTSGFIHRLIAGPAYLQTYRLTGESPPLSTEEGIPLFISQGTVEISSRDPIDIYIWCEGKDGSVRVDI